MTNKNNNKSLVGRRTKCVKMKRKKHTHFKQKFNEIVINSDYITYVKLTTTLIYK